MIDDMLRNNLIIREWVNGGLLPLNISLVIVVVLFLFDEWKNTQYPGGWRELKIHPYSHLKNHYLGWHKRSGVPTACALIWIFAADAIRAGSAWYILWTSNNRIPAPTSSIDNLFVGGGFVLAGIIGLIASVRCIYLFTPSRLRHWYWIVSVLVTIGFQLST